MKKVVVLLLVVVVSAVMYGQEPLSEAAGARYEYQISETEVRPSTSTKTVGYPHGWKLISVQRMGTGEYIDGDHHLLDIEHKFMVNALNEKIFRDGTRYIATFLVPQGGYVTVTVELPLRVGRVVWREMPKEAAEKK